MSNWPITWRARWIWTELPGVAGSPISSGGAPPPETWNRFCYLRRGFVLDEIPGAVPARVTADSRFILYLNGAEAARGPARSIPERLAWTELDLAPFLRRGPNVIAALVRFYGSPVPWWRPAAANRHLGYGSFLFEAPAIRVFSDRAWKGRAAPYQRAIPGWRSLPVPPIEIIDGEQVPRGWSEPEFDDHEWDDAAELRAGTLAVNRINPPLEPYSAPEPDGIAPLTAIPIALKERSRRTAEVPLDDDPRAGYAAPIADAAGADTIITYDAGALTLATPWLELRGPRGATIDLHAGEDLRADGTADPAQRFYAIRYRLGGSGTEKVEGFEAVGFRYLTAIARGGATVERAGAVERRYPRESGAAFECDDERLSRLWQIGARTLDLCSTDAFLDCPGREQRAWLGDSYIHTLLTFTTNPDWRLVRRHLKVCAQSRRGDGLLAMVAAGDMSIAATTIPDYSLHWLRALARYYEYSDDAETVRELRPAADGVIGAFERFRAGDGLIRGMPGWVFIDWAMTERSEVVGALDALYAAALWDFASLLDGPLGDRGAAERMRDRAERTRRAFDLLWDQGRGVYVDAADTHGPLKRVSQQTNAIAIVAGCAPRERWARMLDYVMDEARLVVTPTIHDNGAAYFTQRMDPAEHMRFDPESNVVAAQPFFCHFVNQALAAAERRSELCAHLLKWWRQAERGNSTFEEYWHGPPGGASRCHAWSATPTYDLTAHILGVCPLAPGYARAAVRPWFGRLSRLGGRIPTPHGFIEVEIERSAGGTITVPKGTVVESEFADAPLRGATFGPGRHRVTPV